MFDPAALSTAVLEARSIDGFPPMTRRHRWQPLAFDRVGPAAAVLIAQRARRRASLHLVHLSLEDDGSWRAEEAPSCIDRTDDPSDFRASSRPSGGAGMSRRSSNGWSVARYHSDATVATVGGRQLPIASHGWFVVLASGHTAEKVEVLAASGQVIDTWRVLGRLRPEDGPWWTFAWRRRRPGRRWGDLPIGARWARRLRMWRTRKSADGEWFDYRP